MRRASDRFKWFLASMLFAKRISSQIAKKTYKMFEAKGLVTPDSILRAGWDKLVKVLDEAGYVRYDFSTASTLLETMKKIKELGGLEQIHLDAKDSKDLELKLQELRGVGPTATNIFLRELRGIWRKARPKPSALALEIGKKLGLSIEEIERHESPLVRNNLEYCKRGRCDECSLKKLCRKRANRGHKKTT